ncbi:MAG: sigma-70 family RNA polymerase sigma factor [Chloroflexi bacterium]|nr:MAG: sigma-70 family RNA polymerase sigma factor [Chloroflexota bacterium]
MSGKPRDQDSQMAAQLKRGESTAIESLYDRYGRLAFGLAFRILNERGAAEDVVQDAFVSVWRNAAGFDARRGSLRNWLLSIVRNRAIDRLRGSARVRSEIDLADAGQRAEVPDVWEAVALDLERKQIQEGFRELPDPQRQTLELAYFGGYTHVEIASRMQVPLGTVKSRMRIGLEKMRTFLTARGVMA